MSSETIFDLALVDLRPMANARRMRLRVDQRTGAVLLTYPRRMSRARALAWANEQRGWIEAALADIPPALPLAPGTMVPIEGEPHRIVHDPAASRRVEALDGEIRIGGPEELVETRLLRWLKARARQRLEQETHEYAAKAGVTVTRVGIGDAGSRWGSCSSSGSIRYSWRLILAPAFVRRATVAHEVAHRVHMNHGPRFHALVAELLGEDPGPARLWLRRNGGSLHRIGARSS